ncbi:MAG: ATP-binding protein [Bacillaceae bacterium]|nr:ATP-binding protein [Bacillaceae bacterium]
MLIMNVGLPGSGKSTLISRLGLPASGVEVVNPDRLRSEIFGVTFDKKLEKEIWTITRAIVRGHFRLGRSVFLDATSLTRKRREVWIKMAHQFNQKVYAVYFDMSVDQVLKQNQQRPHPWIVPEEVIREMDQVLEPPDIEEGFASVMVVKDLNQTWVIERIRGLFEESRHEWPEDKVYQ